MRAKLADERHKQHLLNMMSPDIEIRINHNIELETLLPPRRQWVSLLEQERYKTYQLEGDWEYKQKRTSYETNLIRLEKTIESALKNDKKATWINNLRAFFYEIRQSCLDSSYQIAPPKTYPISKNKRNKEGFEECRPISIFQSLKDRVIIALANQYLTQLFDPFFYNESLAFRAQRSYHQYEKYFTTHHDAIDRISEYRLNHDADIIYVAECDMQKFYDSVNHSIIMREFKKLILRVHTILPELDTTIIERIFYSYLNCYSFPRDVYKLNSQKDYWAHQKKIKKGRFEWVEKQLIDSKICKSLRSISRMRIGIPQGGALSGLISNIVLNAADKAVRKHSGDYLYLRYCDDMILMHTDKDKCMEILNQYAKSLRGLKLIPHDFEKELRYKTSKFWNYKSKPVYEWNNTTGSDWIGFVGYEIKRSGEIRIRRASVIKEKLKQKRVAKEICQELRGKRRVSASSIENSIRHKLICMSIGRATLWNYSALCNELCWINGFKKLNRNRFVSQQIRTLDKTRNNVLKKTHQFMIQLKTTDKQDVVERRNKSTEAILYYGYPFSYYYHYLKNSH